ncbi:MAG: hypothetical protein RSG86_07570, partial [Oscillospiraceae bacterium]
MKGDKIIIGADTITEKNVLSGSCYLSNSIACEELTIDTLGATVDCSAGVGTKFLPKGSTGLITKKKEPFYVRPIIRVMVHDLKKYAYGEEVLYYRDGVLFAKFYMESVKRVGKYNYEITCTSAIGLLENSDHYGGIYTGQKMSAVLADIVGGKIAYELDPLFANVTVYGWLPIATRRENLHQLLFAEGASIKKKPDGTLLFTALSADSPKALPGDRLFLGGDVDYKSGATSAAVFEHAYVSYATDAVTTLFDGEVPADRLISPSGATLTGTLVSFDAPMHDLAVTNGTILESGVNYAVLSQSASCKLDGKKYTHTTRTITTAPPATRGLVNVADNTVTVKDATLVSLANSENVAKRVMAYYGSTKLISTDLVVGTERPGDPVTFRDPFDEQADGFIQSLDISMGGFLRAASVLAAGYVPSGIGNNFKFNSIISASGAWTVPAGVFKIRAALIGGGPGGQSGGKGKAGGGGFAYRTMQSGGDGGVVGGAGNGGNVLIVTLSVVPGQVLNIKVGAGGAGGICTSEIPADGTSGEATTLETYTSSNGKSSDKGYIDLFGGGIYALPGSAGKAGAKGSGKDGVGPSVTSDGITYTAGGSGTTVDDRYGWGQGGAGGGAANGGNGKPGTDGSTWVQPNGAQSAHGGLGGDGANGKNGSTASVLGSGGSGGSGGGGGGAGGGARGNGGESVSFGGDGGVGGLGGNGGNGAPGGAIIYY